MTQQFWKSLTVCYKTKPLILAKDSANATLAIYTKKCRTPVDTKICTLMSIVALFIFAKMQLRFPSIGDWQILFSWAPKSLQMVTAAMKLKDACSLKEKL